MSKFKVGDRVIANDRANGRYWITAPGWVGEVVNTESGGRISVRGPWVPDDGHQHDFEVCDACFDIYREPQKKIVVTTDGKTTTARMFSGKELVKSAEAKCSPKDRFDFVAGAVLALDRLLDLKEKVEPEAPNFNKEYLVDGRFGRLNNGSWFVVCGGKLVYDSRGKDPGGFDYLYDVNEDGAVGDFGRVIDCVVEACSFANAASRARVGAVVWSRPGFKFN